MPPEFAAVSVIIPAYRAAGAIARALMSVAAQTVKPIEVVVVDDGSNDGTFEAAMACSEHMNGVRLKVFRQANQGAGAARNRAIGEADQPLVAFLDADDEWLAEKLERSIKRMEETGSVLVAHNGWIVEDGSPTLIDGARRFGEGVDPFVALYRKGYIDTCTVLARRDAVIAAGGFDTTLANAQDFELWLAMLAEPGTRFEVFDDVLSRYHVTPGSIMSNTAGRLRCCLEIAHRHAPALKGRPGFAVVSLWFRVIAVHYEAVRAYRGKGRWAAAGKTAAEMPFQLLFQMLAFIFQPRHERRNFLAQPSSPTGPLESMNDKERNLAFFLWAWVGAVLAAYLYLFSDLAGPILRALGLA